MMLRERERSLEGKISANKMQPKKGRFSAVWGAHCSYLNPLGKQNTQYVFSEIHEFRGFGNFQQIYDNA